MFFDDFTTITRQEQECQFETFNSGDALKLGCLLLENTNSRKRPPLIIDIVLSSHYAMNGTAIDDDYCVCSKIATAKHFGHSSYYIACLLASQKRATTLRQKYFLNEADYSAFPLIIKGTGVVGTITVSGCHYSKDDHYLIYETIRSYLEELEQAAYSQAEH